VPKAHTLILAHFSSLQTLVTFKRTAFAGIVQYLWPGPAVQVFNNQIKQVTILYPQTTLFGNAYFFKNEFLFIRVFGAEKQ